MHSEILNYRSAIEILEHETFRTSWVQVKTCIEELSAQNVIQAQLEMARQWLWGARKAPPVGMQPALNEVIRASLEQKYGWEGQPRLFRSDAEGLAGWKMDFFKDDIGVEVAFNNASYFPWIFSRLNVAGESSDVVKEHKVKVGITICAKRDAKKWGRMDSSVGVFEEVSLWLEVMRPILPIPMALVGLSSYGWEDPPPIFGKGWWKSAKARPYLPPDLLEGLLSRIENLD